MGVTSMVTREGQEVTIAVRGTFDFSVHKQFRSTYVDSSPSTLFTVDLRGADHLDSAALGMLLVLRKFAGGDDAQVRLINANPAVMRVLEIARFDRLFSLS
jgi:HptB-dependent secretion and biofilm anti anti-sigma factor